MRNRIRIASSGRSTCKICKRRIAKGEPRFGLEAITYGRETVKWHHLSCAIKKYPGEIASSWIGDEVVAIMTAEQKETVELLKPISKIEFYSQAWQRDTLVYHSGKTYQNTSNEVKGMILDYGQNHNGIDLGGKKQR